MDRNDYKLTFEDGSKAIAHHGVKGMKWGVWNMETRLKYQGTGKEPRKAAEGGGGGGGVSPEEEKEDDSILDDYKEILDDTHDDKAYERSIKLILDRERGEGNYSKEELEKYIDIARNNRDDKAAEKIYDLERKRKGAKSEEELREERDKREAEDDKRIRKMGGWHFNKKLDARDFGYKDNSLESQKAVYEERGLNMKMSRKEALDKVISDHKKLASERSPIKAEKFTRLGERAVRSIVGLSYDIKAASTLYDDDK